MDSICCGAQQHEAEQLAEYQPVESGLDDEPLASRPRGRAVDAPAPRAAAAQDPHDAAASRKAKRRAQYAARREQAAAAGADGNAEEAVPSDGEDDAPAEPPAKRPRSRKPKPQPVPFLHGPRITSSASEAEEDDPDDLVFNKVPTVSDTDAYTS